MRARLWLTLGAMYGFLAVVMGALGAHAMQRALSSQLMDFWRTAVRFEFYHALALLALGLFTMMRPSPGQTLSGISFSLGIFFFSGSLYVRCLANAPAIAVITPIGGTLLIVGWLALVWSAVQYQPDP